MPNPFRLAATAEGASGPGLGIAKHLKLADVPLARRRCLRWVQRTLARTADRVDQALHIPPFVLSAPLPMVRRVRGPCKCSSHLEEVAEVLRVTITPGPMAVR